METNRLERNVALFSLYATFKDPLFKGPVFVYAIMHLGNMELTELYVCESVVLMLLTLLEVPSGAFADLVGRKTSIVIGSMLHFLSMVWFACMSSVFDVWCANILWAVGHSLTSGADSAFLFDSLKAFKREHDYKRVAGRAFSNCLMLSAFCGLSSGFLAEVHLRLPLLISLPGVLFSTVVTWFFVETGVRKKYSPKEQSAIMKMSVLFVANHLKIKWIICFTVLISVSAKLWFFTYNPYFELVSVELKYFGILFFFLNMVAWFFSRYAYVTDRYISERNILVGMIALTGLPIFLMGTYVSVYAISLIVLQNVVRGLQTPFLGEFINRHIDSKNRATILSIQSASRGVSECIALGVFSQLLGYTTLTFSLQVLGVVVLGFGIIGMQKYQKIF
jgi:MFS family permease